MTIATPHDAERDHERKNPRARPGVIVVTQQMRMVHARLLGKPRKIGDETMFTLCLTDPLERRALKRAPIE